MKKTISLVLVVAFVFALALQLPVFAEDNETNTSAAVPVLTSANIETATTSVVKPEPRKEEKKEMSGMERIPSPDKINLFTQIKKIGKDLFGIRKASSTIANIQKNDDKKSDSATANVKKNDDKKVNGATNELVKKLEEAKKLGLEKIVSLEQVKFFDKITKVGNDLFGIKKPGTYVLPSLSAEQQTCVAAAIDAKDTKISEIITANASGVTTTITARGTCHKAAISLTSGREDAIKACNKIFQESTKAASEKVKTAQKSAWETYRSSLKECSKMTNSSSEIMIEDGGNEIIK
jgi:hypothetical protein